MLKYPLRIFLENQISLKMLNEHIFDLKFEAFVSWLCGVHVNISIVAYFSMNNHKNILWICLITIFHLGLMFEQGNNYLQGTSPDFHDNFLSWNLKKGNM